MQEEFNLEAYLSNGVENIVKGAPKATWNHPRESIFMAKYAIASKKVRTLRMKAEEKGEHIPHFYKWNHGGAEPCPFSPYSDTNIRKVSLREALDSPLFTRLRENNVLLDDHAGGCVLFEKESLVRGLLDK